jgi:AP-1 complex subunit beta-1
LEKAGEECENPDIRDRAYIYWRLLEKDPDAAKEMLLREKPSFIYKDEELFEKSLLDDLVENLTNISCLYQKKSLEMISSEDLILETQSTIDNEEENKDEKNKKDNDIIEKDKKKKKRKNKIIETKINLNDFDLLGLGDSANNITSISSNPNIYNLDIMELFGNGINNSQQSIINNNLLNKDFGNTIKNINQDLLELPNNVNILYNNNQSSNNHNDEFSDIQFLDEDENSENNIFSNVTGLSQPKPYRALEKDHRGKNGVYGLYVSGLFHKENQNLYLGLHIENHFHLGMTNFSISIGKNIFGLNISQNNNSHLNDFFLNSENKKNLTVNINTDTNNKKKEEQEINDVLMIDVSIKNNLDDFLVRIPLYLNILNQENGKMTNQNFMEFFKKYSENKTIVNYTNNLKNEIGNEDSLNKVLEKNNIFLVAKNSKLDPPIYFYSGLAPNNLQYILEISSLKGINCKN